MKPWRTSLCLILGMLLCTWVSAQSAEPVVSSGAASQESSASPKAQTETKSKAERREAHRHLRTAQRRRVK